MQKRASLLSGVYTPGMQAKEIPQIEHLGAMRLCQEVLIRAATTIAHEYTKNVAPYVRTYSMCVWSLDPPPLQVWVDLGSQTLSMTQVLQILNYDQQQDFKPGKPFDHDTLTHYTIEP